MHDIRYDEVNDEIVVPVPYSEAILTFRGDADGQESPIRIIQGPRTGTVGSRVDVDAIHDELFTYNDEADVIKVFPRDANGDVAPIRTIEGPDTQIKSAYGIAVDPINDVLAVGLNSDWGTERVHLSDDPEKGAILLFDRTDSGNVAPRAVIRGPNTGIIRINQIDLNPERRLIVVAMPAIKDQMEPEGAFVGVWSYDDNGDVPPLYKIPIGEVTRMKKPFGVVLNPNEQEVIVSDMRQQGILVFSVPEIF